MTRIHNLATLAISSHAAHVAAQAVSTLAHTATPRWTWNKRINAVMACADRAERNARYFWNHLAQELKAGVAQEKE